MKAIAFAIVATVALTGCNTMTATADKIMDKKSNFSLVESTSYPIGEGPNYNADTKREAALVDMKATQAVNGQYPTAASTAPVLDEQTQQVIQKYTNGN